MKILEQPVSQEADRDGLSGYLSPPLKLSRSRSTSTFLGTIDTYAVRVTAANSSRVVATSVHVATITVSALSVLPDSGVSYHD